MFYINCWLVMVSVLVDCLRKQHMLKNIIYINCRQVMEAALGGALTTYVGDRWQHAKPHGLILQEDEALYFFRVWTPVFFLFLLLLV